MPRTTKFGMWGTTVFLGAQPRAVHHSRGRRPSVPEVFGTYCTRAHIMKNSATSVCTVIKLDVRKIIAESTTPPALHGQNF